MQPMKWWMMIVGALYLMEGIGLAALATLAPDEFAAIWATAAPGSLDSIAVRGILVAGLPGVLTWVMLGSMLCAWAQVRARSRPRRHRLGTARVAATRCHRLLQWL
jgi:hypothetical protein